MWFISKKKHTEQVEYYEKMLTDQAWNLEKLQKKYDELCAMDVQKLYGEERHKRAKAEQQAAVLKAKADSLDEMRIITNAWLATTVEVAGGIELPADRLKANIERGAEPIVTYDSEREIYKLKMVDSCEAE